jgi:DNA processing protein
VGGFSIVNARNLLIALSMKYEGDWDKMIKAIKAREEMGEEQVNDYLCKLRSKAITMADKEYPENWKNSFKPPLVVYYYGDLSYIKDEMTCLAYIGSRDCSPYGTRMAMALAGDAAKEGLTIVTGLARGIDAVATEAALKTGGKAVAVLGSGIDYPYPFSSRELYEKLKTSGLVMSEYPLQTAPTRDNFPARNRLIASMCHGLVVGEASKHSGTLITVSFALGSNKEVGCVPYPADADSACNLLIKDGAFLVENIEDINLMIGFKKEETSGNEGGEK